MHVNLAMAIHCNKSAQDACIIAIPSQGPGWGGGALLLMEEKRGLALHFPLRALTPWCLFFSSVDRGALMSFLRSLEGAVKCACEEEGGRRGP